MERGRGGDSTDALRAIWMEGYRNGQSQGHDLADMVVVAYHSNSDAFVALFGSNAAALVARNLLLGKP